MTTIYSIYRVTNFLDHKQYIGFTSQKPKYRWSKHVKISEMPESRNHHYLHRAMNKHGVENFAFEVIYQSKDLDHTLNVMEPHFIKEFDAFGKNGYNMTNGGDGVFGFSHSEETRAKMSASHIGQTPYMKGKRHTEESKALMSASRTGKATTEEHKAKIGAANSEQWVVTYPDGKTEVVTNMLDFCRQNNLSSGNMSQVAKGQRKQHKGYKCAKA